jgi:hypothetical protein
MPDCKTAYHWGSQGGRAIKLCRKTQHTQALNDLIYQLITLGFLL